MVLGSVERFAAPKYNRVINMLEPRTVWIKQSGRYQDIDYASLLKIANSL